MVAEVELGAIFAILILIPFLALFLTMGITTVLWAITFVRILKLVKKKDNSIKFPITSLMHPYNISGKFRFLADFMWNLISHQFLNREKREKHLDKFYGGYISIAKSLRNRQINRRIKQLHRIHKIHMHCMTFFLDGLLLTVVLSVLVMVFSIIISL